MNIKRWGFRILAAVLAALFVFLSEYNDTAYGFLSSLDSTAGAEIAAEEAGVIAAPTATGASTASLSGGGATVSGSQFGSGSVAAYVGLGAVGAAAALVGLTNGAITGLQQQAASKYCAANPTANVCFYEPLVYNCSNGLVFQAPYPWASMGGSCASFTRQYGYYTYPATAGASAWGSGGSAGGYPVASDANAAYAGQQLPWASWDTASRAAATALLSPSTIAGALTTASLATPSDTTDQNILVSGNTDLGAVAPGGGAATLPQYIPNPSYNSSLTPTPSPTSVTSTGTATGTSTGTGTGLSPAPSTSPSVPIPTYSPIPAQTFCTSTSCENWLQHGIRVFSTKFPFDFVGDTTQLSAGDLNTCPSYTFFSQTFQLCPIRDAVAAMKIPAIAWFIMRTWHSI
jgi:hypothetical protein